MSHILLLGLRYLPSSPAFAPPSGDTKTTDENTKGKRWSSVQSFAFSPLECNTIFVIVACITYWVAGAEVAELEAPRSTPELWRRGHGDAPNGAPEAAPVAGHGGESHRRSSPGEDRDSGRVATGKQPTRGGGGGAAVVAGRRLGRGSGFRASARTFTVFPYQGLISLITKARANPIIVAILTTT